MGEGDWVDGRILRSRRVDVEETLVLDLDKRIENSLVARKSLNFVAHTVLRRI